MSSFVVEKKSIENIASAVAYAANYHNTGVGMFLKHDAIEIAFRTCRDFYRYYDERSIACELYKMNVDAVNQRYAEAGGYDFPIFSDGANLLKNGGDDLIKLAKTLDCYLYQCDEGDIPERPMYQALRVFNISLYMYIVQHTDIYQATPWA